MADSVLSIWCLDPDPKKEKEKKERNKNKKRKRRSERLQFQGRPEGRKKFMSWKKIWADKKREKISE